MNGTVSQLDRDWLVGNLRSVTPTRKTASHSSPLARWTVSSLTESASDGVATSSPWPNSSSASSQASSAASVTWPSTAWNSATAWTKRSRFSRRAAAAGLTDEASSTSMPVVSTIRRTRSRIGSPIAERSRRSSSASSPNRSRASGRVGEVARIVERVAEGRDLRRVGPLDRRRELFLDAVANSWPPPWPPASSRARRPSRARSRGPIAQRGPASSVSSAALAVTSWIKVRVATTSETSGSRSRPLRPTISTGISRSLSASKTAAACALSRVSTPISRQQGLSVRASRSAWVARTCSASHASSSS